MSDDMKKNKLKIKYFGVPTIEYNDTPIKFPIKKLEALIFYVGYYKKAERTELVNLLWCDKGEQTGRKNLRNALYKLKSSVDVEIIEFINDQIITLHGDLEVETDLPNDTETLSEKVLKLDFLNGFQVRNGENFDEWISLKRDQYQSFYNDWLLEKYQYHQTLEDIKQEKKYLKLLIEHDPYNEPYYRQLMVVYQKQQRYNKGIDLYRSLVAVLDKELGIQPDAQTQSVYKELLAEKDAPKETVISAPESFYGRDNQLKALMKLYRDGHRNDMMLIIGEAGIGKTRLKDEFTALISEEVLLVETQSYQLEQHYYLKPWSKILDMIGSYVTDSEIDLPDNWIRMIRTVFPNFKNETELGSFLLKEQTDVLKYPELEDAVVNLFNVVASEKKIVIGVDDLQWMDPLSLDLLKGVLVRCRTAGVVVVATLREGHREAIDDFIALVNRTHPVSEIQLSRFSKEEVTSYVELAMPSVLDKETIDKIYAETEGNTYFLVEYVKSLKEGKALPDVLDGMRDVLHSRLMDIDEEGKKLLNIMSMFFDDIPFELLNQVSSKSELDLIELIEDLKRRNLIKEIESGGRLSYQFIHQKIREFIYRNQSSTARRIFHIKIAELLERNLTGQVRDRLLYPNLIYHFSKGGKLLKGIRYKINNAHTYLDFSHELIPENHHLHASDKASMVISNDMTMELIKDIEATIASLDVIDLSTYEAKEIILEFYHIKGRYYIREGLYEQGFESIQKALNLCMETDNNTYLMNCYLQQIYLCIQTNDLDRMQALIEDGMQIATSKGLTRKFGTMMRLRGLYYLLTQSYDKSLSCLQESINLVEKEDISPYLRDINIAAVYNYMGEIYFYKEKYDQAKLYLKQAIDVSEKHGVVNNLSTFYTNYAKVAYSIGDDTLARQSAEKAIDIFNLTGISWRRSIAENLLVLLELKVGHIESALVHYTNGIIYTMKMKNPMEMDFMDQMKSTIRNNYGEDDRVVKTFGDLFKNQ
jgi:DNA-binding SARP family transcriptional activator